ncbi:uncharacterized protein LOC132619879 [Lycium barbarum]|uniref:uncharacterized protein LOC132619879 n=1 Tax=Lycium barbarum TaxID=112863 RepID=UPI00293F01BF|nr:uncharacterized protein LOC132619879 [Lycium barbarum]
MEHLSRTRSDHASLLLSAGEQVQPFHKHFKFLKFWLEQDSFMQVVEDFWKTDYLGDPFVTFKLKMKKVKSALSNWSKETFIDLFKQLTIREGIAKIKEQLFEEFHSEGNKMWQSEGDRNIIYLHSLVKGRRKRLHLSRIQNVEGEWKEDDDQIAGAAIHFYRSQFTEEETSQDCRLLDVIAPKVTQEQNSLLSAMPTLEEVKNYVFPILGDSACGPDGFSSIFYQKCWNIVGADVYNVVIAFYEGRNIIENVLLTQELVADIRKRGKPANVIVKLDMAKAYNRVSWRFLIQVMRTMGFADMYVVMIWRLIANNWYSILINGQSIGFFHSTRRVKQGDPLSRALFIMTAEVLSTSLNSLFGNNMFRGYGMPKWSAQLNHLSYADDTIIFAYADKESLQMIMGVLQGYEKGSGQKINTDKSAYYMHEKVANDLSQDVHQISGFNRGEFPFTYLGCPIFHVMRQKLFYKDMLKKVRDKLQAWKGKLLLFGRKSVLITSVLQSIPIYLLSAMVPPKCVIKELHKLFNRFFWQTKEDGRSKHWSEWEKMCFPKQEGGVCFRSLFDISKALFAKLWWGFRTNNTLWACFMWNKYCKRFRPTVVQWKGGGSQTWKMTKLGALSNYLPSQYQLHQSIDEVEELMTEGQWNYNMLQRLFPNDIVEHIRQELGHIVRSDDKDKSWWMETSSGKFTVKSAWELLRQKATFSSHYEKLWIKRSALQGVIFLMENLVQEEIMDYLFISSPLASKIWKYFVVAVGIITILVQKSFNSGIVRKFQLKVEDSLIWTKHKFQTS